MNKLHALVVVLVIVFASCNSPKEKAIQQIKQMKANDTVFSPQAIEDLKAAYLDFAAKYPDDEMAPELIFKAAQRCNVIAQHKQAIDLFQSIIEKYPSSRVSEEALFLQGYVYENSMQDYAKAKQTYEQFMLKYPNSELAEDAKMAIRNLGKSPEQALEEILKKQAKDSIQ